MKQRIDSFSNMTDGFSVISSKELKELQSDWINSLSHREKRCFKKYRNSTNNNVNVRIRRAEKKGKDYPSDTEYMSNALKRASVPKDILVYRYMAKKENGLLDDKAIGDIITFPEFKGTHVKSAINIKKHKCGGYLIIKIPKGAEAGYINNVTIWHRPEKELLINRGYSFIIEDILCYGHKIPKIYIVKLLLKE